MMNLVDHHLNDTDLAPYFPDPSEPDDNSRVAALIRQQSDRVKGWPRLINNLESYKQLKREVVNVSGIDVHVTLNETRAPSVTAKTFELARKGDQKKPCFLCQLDNEQKGILTLDERFIILVNPGITIPGDLTIASVNHDPQVIAYSFEDMLKLSQMLTDYAIFFNGALAGASSPHLHFQAGLKNTLIAEKQITQLLNGVSVGSGELQNICHGQHCTIHCFKHFLRALYVIISDDASELNRTFHSFYETLSDIDYQIKDIPNIPDFGSRITSLDIVETEPRMNLMLKFDLETKQYQMAVFPKLFNRPQAYYKSGKDQLLVGMAIKESLGNLISCKHSDYQKLLKTPELISEIYRDTSITNSMVVELNHQLKLNCCI